jgi:hypothetical protein
MKLSLALPEPLLVEIEIRVTNGKPLIRTYSVQPATRGQVKKALALDPEEGSEPTALQLESIRARQAEILAEQSALVITEDPLQVDEAQRIPFEQLTGEQSAELSAALLHHHLGQDPALALAMRRLVKKNVLAQRLIAASASTQKPSISPDTSGSRQRTPSGSVT